MSELNKEIPLIINGDANRFELHIDGHMAVIEYSMKGNVFVLLHTEVDKALEGRGIAAILTEKTFHHLESIGAKIIPLCPYIVGYLKKHPEWMRIVEQSR